VLLRALNCVSSPSSGSGASGRCSSRHPHGQYGLLGGGRGLHGTPQCPVYPLHAHLPPLPLLPPSYPARLRRNRTAGKGPLMFSPHVLGQPYSASFRTDGLLPKIAATVWFQRGFEVHKLKEEVWVGISSGNKFASTSLSSRRLVPQTGCFLCPTHFRPLSGFPEGWPPSDCRYLRMHGTRPGSASTGRSGSS
jgi:hypothetical protein